MSLRFLVSADCMYIFDKTITEFTKEIMFVLWFLLAGSTYTIRTMIRPFIPIIPLSLVNVIIIITQYFTYSKSLIN